MATSKECAATKNVTVLLTATGLLVAGNAITDS
jgi:hypothetical protein